MNYFYLVIRILSHELQRIYCAQLGVSRWQESLATSCLTGRRHRGREWFNTLCLQKVTVGTDYKLYNFTQKQEGQAHLMDTAQCLEKQQWTYFLKSAVFERRKTALAIKGVITTDIYPIEDNISILLVKHANCINNIKRKWVLKIKYYLTSSFIF